MFLEPSASWEHNHRDMSIEIIKRTVYNDTVDRLLSIVVLLYLQGLFGAIREVSDNLFHAAGNLAFGGCHDAMAALGMILQPATLATIFIWLWINTTCVAIPIHWIGKRITNKNNAPVAIVYYLY